MSYFLPIPIILYMNIGKNTQKKQKYLVVCRKSGNFAGYFEK